MSELAERLDTIRAHLRTGALGQREVWEAWLTEAGSEIERLTAAVRQHEEVWQPSLVQQLVDKDDGIERLLADNGRLRAALQEIVDSIIVGRETPMLERARRALEPTP